ncbi:MAG TPA: ferritin family protein [Rhizomicrobium sp.]
MFGFKRRKPVIAAAPPSLLHASPEPPRPAPSPPPSAPPPLSGGDLHIPRARLSQKNLHVHYAINSIREELEAVDWYRQRADDTDDEELKAILLHNADEEIEHASMLLEWLRRKDARFDKELREYLFTDGPILSAEKRATGRE